MIIFGNSLDRVIIISSSVVSYGARVVCAVQFCRFVVKNYFLSKTRVKCTINRKKRNKWTSKLCVFNRNRHSSIFTLAVVVVVGMRWWYYWCKYTHFTSALFRLLGITRPRTTREEVVEYWLTRCNFRSWNVVNTILGFFTVARGRGGVVWWNRHDDDIVYIIGWREFTGTVDEETTRVWKDRFCRRYVHWREFYDYNSEFVLLQQPSCSASLRVSVSFPSRLTLLCV